MHPRRPLVLALLFVALAGPASGAGKDHFPTTVAAAIEYYESDPDQWIDGPVEYLILDQERAQFATLTSRWARERFIQRFWERRDFDHRDGVDGFKHEFYERVAQANRRYNEYPKGWQSDRGQVHLVLGRPDFEQRSPDGAGEVRVWTYYTIGPRGNDFPVEATFGEVKIWFFASNARSRFQIVGDFGPPGMIPTYVRDALEFAKIAAVDPSFGRPFVQ